MNDLEALGRALGGADMVQGPGGNVSVKDGDALAVKASGVRLRDLDRETARARVPIAAALAALDGDEAADRALHEARPRPSLEAYFHAFGPRVVAHTHAMGALLVACARTTAPPSLPGVALRVVPYARPGRALALAVRAALDGAAWPAVVLLRSHGVIVYADGVDEAVALTQAFDRACRAREAHLEPLDARIARYRAAPPRAVPGGLALPVPFAPGAPGRALFPDAAVFCPWVGVASLEAFEGVAGETLAAAGRPAVLSDGARRVVVAPTAQGLDFAVEVLAAHDALEEALGDGGQAAHLPPDEVLAVASMPSELYRLKQT